MFVTLEFDQQPAVIKIYIDFCAINVDIFIENVA